MWYRVHGFDTLLLIGHTFIFVPFRGFPTVNERPDNGCNTGTTNKTTGKGSGYCRISDGYHRTGNDRHNSDKKTKNLPSFFKISDRFSIVYLRIEIFAFQTMPMGGLALR